MIDAIFARRSIRQFTDRPVPPEVIDAVLRAGMAAPSAGNEQPWHFVVLNDRVLLDQVPTFHPNAKMILQAPAAVLLCADLTVVKHGEMWIQDCAAATQNMLLAIHDAGLASVWLGIHPRAERVKGLIRLCNLPANVTPFSLLPIGYGAEEKPRNDRYLADRVHWNQW